MNDGSLYNHYASNYLDMCIVLKTHQPKEARVITLIITAQWSNWTPQKLFGYVQQF